MKIRRFTIGILVLMCVMLFMAVKSYAAPFLVCDPDPVATKYLVQVGENIEVETLAPLHFDLSNMPEGLTLIKVKAGNEWGVSIAAPFECQKTSSQSPIGLRLSNK